LFKILDRNDAGIYCISLCVGGKWNDVLIDDWLPYNGFEAAFAKNSDGCIWPCLLEKAWAKVCGNYANIVNGTTDLAFIHLCGMPSIEYKHRDYNLKGANITEFWSAIVNAFNNNHVVLAGTCEKGTPGVETLLANGIYANHCYSVLSTHTIIGARTRTQLLRVRNPWGTGVWGGKWSAGSKEWTNDNKELVDYKEEDGVFYITVEDFLKNFSRTNICKIEDDIYTHSITVQKDDQKPDYFRFELTEHIEDLSILVS
jgi:hypothetical protein